MKIGKRGHVMRTLKGHCMIYENKPWSLYAFFYAMCCALHMSSIYGMQESKGITIISKDGEVVFPETMVTVLPKLKKLDEITKRELRIVESKVFKDIEKVYGLGNGAKILINFFNKRAKNDTFEHQAGTMALIANMLEGTEVFEACAHGYYLQQFGTGIYNEEVSRAIEMGDRERFFKIIPGNDFHFYITASGALYKRARTEKPVYIDASIPEDGETTFVDRLRDELRKAEDIEARFRVLDKWPQEFFDFYRYCSATMDTATENVVAYSGSCLDLFNKNNKWVWTILFDEPPYDVFQTSFVGNYLYAVVQKSNDKRWETQLLQSPLTKGNYQVYTYYLRDWAKNRHGVLQKFSDGNMKTSGQRVDGNPNRICAVTPCKKYKDRVFFDAMLIKNDYSKYIATFILDPTSHELSRIEDDSAEEHDFRDYCFFQRYFLWKKQINELRDRFYSNLHVLGDRYKIFRSKGEDDLRKFLVAAHILAGFKGLQWLLIDIHTKIYEILCDVVQPKNRSYPDMIKFDEAIDTSCSKGSTDFVENYLTEHLDSPDTAVNTDLSWAPPIASTKAIDQEAKNIEEENKKEVEKREVNKQTLNPKTVITGGQHPVTVVGTENNSLSPQDGSVIAYGESPLWSQLFSNNPDEHAGTLSNVYTDVSGSKVQCQQLWLPGAMKRAIKFKLGLGPYEKLKKTLQVMKNGTAYVQLVEKGFWHYPFPEIICLSVKEDAHGKETVAVRRQRVWFGFQFLNPWTWCKAFMSLCGLWRENDA
jgi:hypothetical protein